MLMNHPNTEFLLFISSCCLMLLSSFSTLVFTIPSSSFSTISSPSLCFFFLHLLLSSLSTLCIHCSSKLFHRTFLSSSVFLASFPTFSTCYISFCFQISRLYSFCLFLPFFLSHSSIINIFHFLFS